MSSQDSKLTVKLEELTPKKDVKGGMQSSIEKQNNDTKKGIVQNIR
jgi:hypothetical protein